MARAKPTITDLKIELLFFLQSAGIKETLEVYDTIAFSHPELKYSAWADEELQKIEDEIDCGPEPWEKL